MKYKLLFLAILSLSSITAYAQVSQNQLPSVKEKQKEEIEYVVFDILALINQKDSCELCEKRLIGALKSLKDDENKNYYTHMIRQTLSIIYTKQNKYDLFVANAGALLEQYKNTKNTISYGNFSILNQLAFINQINNKIDIAENYANQSLAIAKKLALIEDKNIVNAINTKNNILYKTSKYKEIIINSEDFVTSYNNSDIKKQTHNDIVNDLIVAYIFDNQLDKAEFLLQNLIKDKKLIINKSLKQTLDVEYNNLGLVYIKRQKYDIAEGYINKALDLQGDKKSIMTLINKAQIFIGQNKYQESVEILKSTLEIKDNQDLDEKQIARINALMAYSYKKQNNVQKSLEFKSKAQEFLDKNSDSNNYYVKSIKEILSRN